MQRNLHKTKKNTTQYVLDATIGKQSQTTQIKHEPSYKDLKVTTNPTSFLCGDRKTGYNEMYLIVQNIYMYLICVKIYRKNITSHIKPPNYQIKTLSTRNISNQAYHFRLTRNLYQHSRGKQILKCDLVSPYGIRTIADFGCPAQLFWLACPQRHLNIVSSVLTLSLADEGYFTNASCALNQIHTLLFFSNRRNDNIFKCH